MLVANSILTYDGAVVEPGQELPEGLRLRFRAHTLEAYLTQRKILDVDKDRAKEIRERYLAQRRAEEEKLFRKTQSRLAAEVQAARDEVTGAADAARVAEAEHQRLVEQRQAAEAEAKERLQALDAQLAALRGSNSDLLDTGEDDTGEDDTGEDDTGEDDTGEGAEDEAPELLSKSQLKGLNKADLQALAEQWGLLGAEGTREELIDLIMEAQAEHAEG